MKGVKEKGTGRPTLGGEGHKTKDGGAETGRNIATRLRGLGENVKEFRKR